MDCFNDETTAANAVLSSTSAAPTNTEFSTTENPLIQNPTTSMPLYVYSLVQIGSLATALTALAFAANKVCMQRFSFNDKDTLSDKSITLCRSTNRKDNSSKKSKQTQNTPQASQYSIRFNI